tara:strand:+ start:38 stop:2557 length:2520 start_codon:yes stop_codon:yes gene_type:complete
MKKTIFVILSLSICLASENLPKKINKLIRSIQDTYQIYTPEDLNKLKTRPFSRDRANFIRDMSDIVGQWHVDGTNIALYVTVGTEQSIPNYLSLMAMDTAAGSISATHSDYETELNYLIAGALMGGDNEDNNDDDPVNDSDGNDSRNADALTFAQDYVDDNSSQYDQTTFDLVTEFSLTVDGDNVSGGLGGTNPGNCEINWPEDPYKIAVYSFVSEYVLAEGESVGCFVDNDNIDQTYENVALDMESAWSGDDDDDDDDEDYSYGPRIGAYLTDLDPSVGGHVYFDDTDTEATITFLDVPLIDNSSALNTFQIQLVYATDEVVITYKDLFLTGENTFEAAGGLAIGIADGGGEYVDVDLSETSGEYYSVPVEGYSSSSELDMEYKKITFKPNDDFSSYSVSAETVTDLGVSYSNEITVEDDDYSSQSLSSEFKFYGTSWDQIYINNDGNIGFEEGDETCVCWICDDGDGECAARYLAGGNGGNGENGENDPDYMIMNFDFWNLFSFIFGFSPEGVDHPMLVTIDIEEEMVVAQGFTAFGQDPNIYFANPSDFSSSVTIDTVETRITFSELDLIDSTGAVVLALDGTIGPGMFDLMADVETKLPFPEALFEQGQEEVYMTFYEDSTGIDVTISEDYYEEVADTSDFYWYATGDSLYTINEEDYYYSEADWEPGLYEFSGDTLIISDEDHPCDEYYDYYGSMDGCMEQVAEDLPMVNGLEDVEGFYIYLESVMSPIATVSIAPDESTLPKQFVLYPAYPNPFNPTTTLRYELPEDAIVNITIYDMMGRIVKTLVNSSQTAGYKSIQWGATNARNEPVSAGMYIYTIQAGEFRQTRKMVLLK